MGKACPWVIGLQLLWPPFVHLYVGGWEVYLGWRPTPPWPPGVGDEGIFPRAARWLKRRGLGNLGAAFRRNAPGAVGWLGEPWLVRKGF